MYQNCPSVLTHGVKVAKWLSLIGQKVVPKVMSEKRLRCAKLQKNSVNGFLRKSPDLSALFNASYTRVNSGLRKNNKKNLRVYTLKALILLGFCDS